LSAGLSDYFYYGTRLLPFILILYFCYILIFHWKQGRDYLMNFGLLAAGVTASFQDLQNAWKTVWPVIRENFLGMSTHNSQDIIYYAPLLLPAEAAILVLGVALLVWRWRHPAAFLMLISGLGVLFVGGTLVAYSNSVPPLINHWTPAFPAFYVALAVPIERGRHLRR